MDGAKTKQVGIFRFILFALLFFLCIASIFVACLSYYRSASALFGFWSWDLDLDSTILFTSITFISLYFMYNLITKHRHNLKILSILAGLILFCTNISLIYFFKADIHRVFSAFASLSIILVLFIGAVCIQILMHYVLIKKNPLTIGAIVNSLFFLSIYIIGLYLLASDLFINSTINIKNSDLFSLFPIITAPSILLSLIYLQFLHRQMIFKIISTHLGIAIFSLFVSAFILAIFYEFYEFYSWLDSYTSFLDFLSYYEISSIGAISILIYLLLYFIPLNWHLTKLSLKITSFSLFGIYLIITGFSSFKRAAVSYSAYNNVPPEARIFISVYANDIHRFYESFSQAFVMDLVNLLIVFVFIFIYMIIVYMIAPKKYYPRKLFAATVIVLYLANIVLALYITNVSPFMFFVPGGRSGGGETNLTDVFVENLQVIPTPEKIQEMQVGQTFRLTLVLVSKDGHTLLNKLKVPDNNTGQDLPIQSLLGIHNRSCVSARLRFDKDNLNIDPSLDQEYPLNQQSVRWDWIVKPKQAGKQFIEADIKMIGKPHCGISEAEGEVVEGPYHLFDRPVYSFTVVDPNENFWHRLLRSFDPGTSLTNALGGGLGLSLAAFIGWVSVGVVKQIRAKHETPGTVVLEVKDPTGDDHGPGNYVYPTDPSFHPGAFDIQRFCVIISLDGSMVTFKLKVRNLTPAFGSPLGAQLVDVYVHNPNAAPGDTTTVASFPQRNYVIDPGAAWSRLIEVHGFGQRYIDAHNNTVGTVTISADALSRFIIFSVPTASLGGQPGSGWGFTVVLTGQDGSQPDQARAFTSTPGQFTFGVCATTSNDPHCTVNPNMVPKAMDVLTPPGVSQSDELDYTMHNPVTLRAVVIR